MPSDLSGYEARNAEREKIKAAATKGPWKPDHVLDGAPSHMCTPILGANYETPAHCYGGQNRMPNAAFIAAARNDEVERDVRELIAMVKEQDAEIDRLRAIGLELAADEEAYQQQASQLRSVSASLHELQMYGDKRIADLERELYGSRADHKVAEKRLDAALHENAALRARIAELERGAIANQSPNS